MDYKKVAIQIAKETCNVPKAVELLVERMALPIVQAYVEKTKTPFDDMAFNFAKAQVTAPLVAEVEAYWNKLGEDA